MKFSFTSSWFLFVLATPSVIAKKGKKTKNTKNKNGLNLSCDPRRPSCRPYRRLPIIDLIDNDNDSDNNLGTMFDNNRNLKCDLMVKRGCKSYVCASDRWKDGCLACMCFNNGNDSWCDGTQGLTMMITLRKMERIHLVIII